MHERNDNRALVFLVGILVVIAVGVTLNAMESILLPMVIAWLLSYILGPVVTFLTRRRVPTGLATTFVLILLLTICYQAARLLQGRIIALTAVYPDVVSQLATMAGDASARWKLPFDYLVAIDWSQKMGDFLVSLTGPLVAFFSKLTLVLVFLVFMLLGKPYFQNKIQLAFTERQATRIASVLATVSSQIGSYLSLQLLISAVTGVVVWLALMLLGVRFALTWGAVAFFLNFIPTLGSIIGAIPPVLMALVQYYDSPYRVVAVAVVLLAIQMTIGNVIAPKLFGDRLNLSPVVVMVSLVFWGWLWGATGALLSVPIAAAIKIVCQNVDPLKPISILMGSGKYLVRHAERAAEPPQSRAPDQ